MMLSPRTQIALFAALVFVIIGSPAMYKLTNNLIGARVGLPYLDVQGVPTRVGLLVHAVVAALLTWVYLRTFRM